MWLLSTLRKVLVFLKSAFAVYVWPCTGLPWSIPLARITTRLPLPPLVVHERETELLLTGVTVMLDGAAGIAGVGLTLGPLSSKSVKYTCALFPLNIAWQMPTCIATPARSPRW